MSSVQAASPMTALQPDLPAPSPSTTWESSTPDVPPSMETPHPGVPPRLMPTTTMSPELVPGDTVMPLALFKVWKIHNSIGEGGNSCFSYPETVKKLDEVCI